MDSRPWGQCAPADVAPATLAVGCFASICRGRLADLLMAFGETAPDVDVGVHEMPRTALLPALAAGELDLVVMPARPLTDRPHLPLWRDRAMVAMACDHPLAEEAELRPDALAAETFLISRQEQGGDLHRFLVERLVPPPPLSGVLCNIGLPRLLDRVATGRELALVPATVPFGDGVTTRPFADGAGGFTVHAYWRDRAPAEPLATLIRSLAASAQLHG